MINMWRKHQTVRSVKERLICRVLLRLHVAGDRMTNVGNPVMRQGGSDEAVSSLSAGGGTSPRPQLLCSYPAVREGPPSIGGLALWATLGVRH